MKFLRILAHSAAPLAFLLIAIPVVGCCKKSEASSEKIGIAECDEYLTRAALCAHTEKNEKRREEKIKDVETMREEWLSLKKDPKGLNLQQHCESTLRLARNPATSEYQQCPSVWR